jgi:hypothetical protein
MRAANMCELRLSPATHRKVSEIPVGRRVFQCELRELRRATGAKNECTPVNFGFDRKTSDIGRKFL